MSLSTTSTDQSTTSELRDVGSFLVPRDPSITNPWMRPRPTHGTNLCFDDSTIDDQHLKVYLRIKPQKKTQTKDIHFEIKSTRSLLTIHPADRKTSKGKNLKVQKLYNFTHIFNEFNNSQEDVFNKVIKDDLAKFVEGQDFTIITYGASGSGKTYSLMGTDSEPGIIPRCLEALFSAIQIDRQPQYKPTDGNSAEKLNSLQKEMEVQEIQKIMKKCHGESYVKNNMASYHRMSMHLLDESNSWQYLKKNHRKYEVWVSFAEIYNETICDLLRPETHLPKQPPPRLRLVHSTNNQPYIKGIKWIYVRNGTEAFAALERGRCRLRVAHTNINSQSSRSHCLFSLKLVQYDSDHSEVSINTFRLCDLAGSERAKRTGNEGMRLTESRNINTSLHVLERCLASLRSQQDGQQIIPPYRESKLTSLLQNALSGNEAIAMLVTINPEPSFFDETQHTLQFSAIAKNILGYIEPKEHLLLKSKSSINLSKSSLSLSPEQCSDFSAEISISNESYYYNEEIESIRAEFEKKIQQREREVRKEITLEFSKRMQERVADFEETLKKQRQRTAELHEWEVRRLEERFEQMHKVYKEEIESLEEERAILEKKLKELTNNRQREETNVSAIETVIPDKININGTILSESNSDNESEYFENSVKRFSNQRAEKVDSISGIQIETTEEKKISLVVADKNISFNLPNISNDTQSTVGEEHFESINSGKEKSMTRSFENLSDCAEEVSFESANTNGIDDISNTFQNLFCTKLSLPIVEIEEKSCSNIDNESGHVTMENESGNGSMENESGHVSMEMNSLDDQYVDQKDCSKEIINSANNEHSVELLKEPSCDDKNSSNIISNDIKSPLRISSEQSDIEMSESDNNLRSDGDTSREGYRADISKDEETSMKSHAETHKIENEARENGESNCHTNSSHIEESKTIATVDNSENISSTNTFYTPPKKHPVKCEDFVDQDAEKENLYTFKNKYFTEKKEKCNSTVYSNGACTVGNSRRKLFTKRQFDEIAAETREPAKSTRFLDFNEDSPGCDGPLRVEKPYENLTAIEKSAKKEANRLRMTLRSRRRKY